MPIMGQLNLPRELLLQRLRLVGTHAARTLKGRALASINSTIELSMRVGKTELFAPHKNRTFVRLIFALTDGIFMKFMNRK